MVVLFHSAVRRYLTRGLCYTTAVRDMIDCRACASVPLWHDKTHKKGSTDQSPTQQSEITCLTLLQCRPFLTPCTRCHSASNVAFESVNAALCMRLHGYWEELESVVGEILS
jgi:hypothetical protein